MVLCFSFVVRFESFPVMSLVLLFTSYLCLFPTFIPLLTCVSLINLSLCICLTCSHLVCSGSLVLRVCLGLPVGYFFVVTWCCPACFCQHRTFIRYTFLCVLCLFAAILSQLNTCVASLNSLVCMGRARAWASASHRYWSSLFFYLSEAFDLLLAVRMFMDFLQL